MTLSELADLCEGRINDLSRERQRFEHIEAPEHVAALIEDLRATASGWDDAVDSPPGGNPATARDDAQAVRDAMAGLGVVETVVRGQLIAALAARDLEVMADALEGYATALESGQAEHGSGAAELRAAQQGAARLPAVDGDAGPDATDAAAVTAIAVLDAACAGYASCQDGYETVLEAEQALHSTVERVSRSGHPSDLSG